MLNGVFVNFYFYLDASCFVNCKTLGMHAGYTSWSYISAWEANIYAATILGVHGLYNT